VTGKTIYNSVQNLFEETYELEIKNGLGLVDFQTIPHLNSPYFTKIRTANLERSAKSIIDTVYAIDDNSAVIVDDQTIEVVSEGTWAKYN
jgi:dipeptidase E